MNKENAIKILVTVANLAQKGGLLSLQDAVAVAQAVQVLTPEEETGGVETPTPKPKKV